VRVCRGEERKRGEKERREERGERGERGGEGRGERSEERGERREDLKLKFIFVFLKWISFAHCFLFLLLVTQTVLVTRLPP
jgi:hypothetical protein